MYSKPKRIEIDHHTIKLIMGIIAISLAALTSFFSDTPIQSISASYHEGGWARDIFVGFLFTICALMLAYNGRSTYEMVCSKIAAMAALAVALFPCKCGDHEEIIVNAHGIAAFIMFSVLVIFCYLFFRRASSKGHPQARVRAIIYAICGVTIVATMLILLIDHIIDGRISLKITRLTYYCEAAALVAYGVAWLVASRIIPIITHSDERLTLSPFSDRQSDPDLERVLYEETEKGK